MTETVWGLLGGVAGVFVTAIVTYLVARRKSSGTVDTSEADSLWNESRTLRDALRDEVRDLRANLTLAVATENQLRQALYEAQMKTGELTLRVAALEQRLERYEDGHHGR